MGNNHKIPMAFNDDQDWTVFVVQVVNRVDWDLPGDMRIGQKLMIALGDESVWLSQKITGTEFDIWEASDPLDPKIRLFWERVFELFVQAL